jgi:hypothetical protein
MFVAVMALFAFAPTRCMPAQTMCAPAQTVCAPAQTVCAPVTSHYLSKTMRRKLFILSKE